MKKFLYPILGLSIIAVAIVLIIIFNKKDFELVGNHAEIYYTIDDDRPDLLDGVYGIVDDTTKVHISIDESNINWSKVGFYIANYIYNDKIVGTTKVIVRLKKPYIINHVDLIYYLDRDDDLNFFATDIRAYDVHNIDITFDKANKRRITVDDCKVSLNKIGVYQATYKIVDDYGNQHEEAINVTVRKTDKTPVIYGFESPLYIVVGRQYNKDDLLIGIEAYSSMAVNITEDIIVDDSRIDINKQGIYYLEYSIADKEFSTKAGREVIVIDAINPLITGVKDYTIINIGDLDTDLLSGIKAYDYVDKELTDNIELYFRHKNDETLLDIFDFLENYINEVGDYYIVYKVANSFKITSYQEMYLKVILDVNPPVIKGTKDIIHSAGKDIPNYLLDVIAYKIYDEDIQEDLTESIVVKLINKTNNLIVEINEIDYNVLSTYVILYSVTDTNGFTTEVQRNLYIVDEEEPVFYNLPQSFTYIITPDGEVDNELPNYKKGVVAWDLVDGDLTSDIAVDESNVDYSIAGQYYIEYSVSDLQDNTAKQTVIVYVKFE